MCKLTVGLSCIIQAAIEDIDAILGTTEANRDRPPPSRSPQLQAPRPREMQRILQEHQQTMFSTADKDRKEMEEHREQQLSSASPDQKVFEKLRRESFPGRVGTGQSSAPPPSPALPASPAASVVLLYPDAPHPPEDELSEGKQQPMAPRPPSGPNHTTCRKGSPRFRTEVGGKGNTEEQVKCPSEEISCRNSNKRYGNNDEMDEKNSTDSTTTQEQEPEAPS